MLKLLLAFLVLMQISACDKNIYESVVKPEGDRALMEEARVRIDERDYSGALQALDSVSSDSNDLRLLRSSARLGASGLSVWQILLDIVDGVNFNSESGSGIDNFFNDLSASVLGTGSERTGRIEALKGSIQDLLAAPEPAAPRVKNLACFLAGIIAVPTATDAAAAITDLSTYLTALGNTVDLNNPSSQCPDTNGLNSALSQISDLQDQFSLILEATRDCKILDVTGAGAQLNAIEIQLQKFMENADKGCSQAPACGSSTACKALGLECVYQALTSQASPTLASDGTVSTCEIVQNCLTANNCF